MIIQKQFSILLIQLILIGSALTAINKRFPDDFLFGTATASYQIEGAWNEGGKGESIWDRFTHQHPGNIADASNGDIACNSYHKYLEDVALLKDLGVNFYRFSLSWSRILPNGTIDNVNQAGVAYYKNLIKTLKNNGIEPYVTLYHWDLPQAIEDKGGWPNETIIDYFADYARLAFNLFGGEVKNWMTHNEPKQTCSSGYGTGIFAPGVNSSGLDEYKCIYHVLKSHARVYHIYDKEYRPTQGGRIGIVLDTDWFEPASNSTQDLEAAERKMQFEFGIYANAIFHKDGNYPQIVIDRVANRSKLEGFSQSRLPTLTPEELEYIKGTSDFFGLNIYTASVAEWIEDAPIGSPSMDNDVSVKIYQDPSWPPSSADWLKVVPWSARSLILWVHEHYDHPEIIVTENGFSDDGQLDDSGRIDYYREYLSSILQAKLEDGANVTAYTAWSLMDNFEWLQGYTQKYGLYKVNFEDPDRKRSAKYSSVYYKNLIKTRCLVDTCE